MREAWKILKLFKNPKLTYIQWLDAHSNSGWHTREQIEKFIEESHCITEQVGWVVFEDDKILCIISRKLLWPMEDTVEFGMIQKIPKTWIKKRKVIKI